MVLVAAGAVDALVSKLDACYISILLCCSWETAGRRDEQMMSKQMPLRIDCLAHMHCTPSLAQRPHKLIVHSERSSHSKR
jgi:hypothetical protein